MTNQQTHTPRKARVIGKINRRRARCDSEGCTRIANTLHIIGPNDDGKVETLAACPRHDWGGYWLDLYGADGLLGDRALHWWAHLQSKRASWRRAVLEWVEDHDLADLWVERCQEAYRRDPTSSPATEWNPEWPVVNFVGYAVDDKEGA